MGIDEMIRVVSYDEQWPILFDNERLLLFKTFGDSAIDIQILAAPLYKASMQNRLSTF